MGNFFSRKAEPRPGNKIETGINVKIAGLTSKKGKLLNGGAGTVVGFDSKSARYYVNMLSGDMLVRETVLIKPAKLIPVEIGSSAEIAGLTSEAGKLLNGGAATVVGFDPNKGRFKVMVEVYGKERFIKAENLVSFKKPEITAVPRLDGSKLKF